MKAKVAREPGHRDAGPGRVPQAMADAFRQGNLEAAAGGSDGGS